MAKCAVCEKSQSNGNKLSITRSHISKRSPRTWKPNLRSVKAIMENGVVKKVPKFLRGFVKLIFGIKD